MTKLIGLAMVGTLVVGVAAALILSFLGRVDAAYDEVVSRIQPADTAASDLESAAFRQISAVRGYLLAPSPDLRHEFQQAALDLGKQTEQIRSLTRNEGVLEHVTAIEQLGKEYTALGERMITLADQGRLDEATRLVRTEGMPLIAKILDRTNQVNAHYRERAATAAEQARDESALARLVGYITLPVGFALALLIGFLAARSMATSIRRISEAAIQVAAGNLQVEEIPATNRDEVGDMAQAFNQMVASLRTLIHEVTASAAAVLEASSALGDVSEQASQAASQVASAMQHVASGGTTQAESTADVQKTMAQLQDAIRQVAIGAEQTTGEIQQAVSALHQVVGETEQMAHQASTDAAIVGEGAQSAADGARAVKATTTGMERVKEAVDRSAEQVRKLATLSQQIGAITTAISNIADQTNLLALNAAIEAARAGDHGRGFAVVADEVRQLAEGASTSAREIAQLIEAIQAGTSEVVESMEAGLVEVEAGVRQANEASQILTRLQDASEVSAKSVQGIAAAAEGAKTRLHTMEQLFDTIVAVAEENSATAEEMAASAAEVSAALESVSTIAQDNAATTEEVSASVEEVAASSEEVAASATSLQQIARGLQEQVARFRS